MKIGLNVTNDIRMCFNYSQFRHKLFWKFIIRNHLIMDNIRTWLLIILEESVCYRRVKIVVTITYVNG